MNFRIAIDTDKLPADNQGGALAEILRDLANHLEDNSHFDPKNLINGSWGACPLIPLGSDKTVGCMEITGKNPDYPYKDCFNAPFRLERASSHEWLVYESEPCIDGAFDKFVTDFDDCDTLEEAVAYWQHHQQCELELNA
jgi:hypothetical protein